MTDSNRSRVIDWYRRRMEDDRRRCTEAVAAVALKIASGKPCALEYEFRWGNGVAQDVKARYLTEGITLLDQVLAHVLDTLPTPEDLCRHLVDHFTEKAMRVEHSSNPFACAVSLIHQEIAREVRSEWKDFLASLVHATKEDVQLALEKEAGVDRTTIREELRIIDDPVSRKLLAAMRKTLKARGLRESSFDTTTFWINREDVVVYGLMGKDKLTIEKVGDEYRVKAEVA